MKTTRAACRQMSRAICRSCGIDPQNLPEAADAVCDRAVRRPRSRRFAAAVEGARRCLAAELGVPRRSLPADLARLSAIGRYEQQRRRWGEYALLDGEPWQHSFELESRRFAIENGVCPRCSAPGTFPEAAGSCACGYGYN
jgi:hypothetical protein